MKTKLFFLLIFRFYHINTQHILLNSIPKCGTYLLIRCLKLITNKQGIHFNQEILQKFNSLPKNSVLFNHFIYTEATASFFKNQKLNGIFIYRDPRDQIVSHTFWVFKEKLFDSYGFGNGKNVKFQDVFTELIKRSDKFYNNFIPWIRSPIFLSIKYEDLVGPKGGGTTYNQYKTVRKICNFLNIKIDPQNLNRCIALLYGESKTFRQGKIGSWKRYFSSQEKELFKKINGRLLITLGYEKDNNW